MVTFPLCQLSNIFSLIIEEEKMGATPFMDPLESKPTKKDPMTAYNFYLWIQNPFLQ